MRGLYAVGVRAVGTIVHNKHGTGAILSQACSTLRDASGEALEGGRRGLYVTNKR